MINNTDRRVSAAKTILLNKLFDSESIKFIDPGRILSDWKVQDIHHGKDREMAQLLSFIKLQTISSISGPSSDLIVKKRYAQQN